MLYKDAQRQLRPGRSPLPASPRRPVVRLGRGVRAALQLPRLAVRRRPASASSSRSRRSRTPTRASRTASRIKAYPVEAKAGLLWAYLGPPPAPLVPDWEPFTWSNGFVQIVFTEIPCNWFQCQENSIDPVHFEWLHGNWGQRCAGSRGNRPPHPPARSPSTSSSTASPTGACARASPSRTSCGRSAACACGRTACSPATTSSGACPSTTSTRSASAGSSTACPRRWSRSRRSASRTGTARSKTSRPGAGITRT